MAQTVEIAIKDLVRRGIEVLPRSGANTLRLPVGSKFEPPCSLKWVETAHSFELGAFSYHVSGYAFAVSIGRYCSFGEGVQIGRQDHPTRWASTSPAFYNNGPLFDVGSDFQGASDYVGFRATPGETPTQVVKTEIANDVWIGHGAYIRAGIKIGTGAIVAAHAVVTKDVPAYSIVAGNPAAIKRLRLPSELISPMLKSQWWRFAPWQLPYRDVADPAKFVHLVMQMQNKAQYQPPIIQVSETGLFTVNQ